MKCASQESKGGQTAQVYRQMPLNQRLHMQIALGLQIVQFTETLEDMFVNLAPNRITEYVYELANLFSTFYTECKVSLLPGMAKHAAASVPN